MLPPGSLHVNADPNAEHREDSQQRSQAELKSSAHDRIIPRRKGGCLAGARVPRTWSSAVSLRLRPGSGRIELMTRRFQFSLARALIALTLLCAALGLHRHAKTILSAYPPLSSTRGLIDYRSPVRRTTQWAYNPRGTTQTIYNPTILERHPFATAASEMACGVCVALAVGVMARRTLSFLAGAVVAMLPMLWILQWL